MESSVHPRQPRTSSAVVILLLVVYAAMRQFPSDDVFLAVLLSAIMYFLAVAAFYGAARLVYESKLYVLVGIALGAALLESVVTGFEDTWLAFTTWGMIVGSGWVIGRYSRRQMPPGRVFVISLFVTIVFSVAQYAPYWGKLMEVSADQMTGWADVFHRSLISAGDSADLADEKTAALRQISTVILRLIPAATVLSTLTQFSVGYLLFVRWASMHGLSLAQFRPFFEWKMPFAFMPVIMALILVRLFGGEGLKIFADNALAMASIFYSLTGLALIEYGMRKLQLTILLKVMFYLFLFITQFIGFVAAVLLGFIDSFADWRKVGAVNAG